MKILFEISSEKIPTLNHNLKFPIEIFDYHSHLYEIFPKDPSIVIASIKGRYPRDGSGGGEIYTSKDGGKSFKKINVKLPVTAPFHCELMNEATKIMCKEITNNEFKTTKNHIISNVTAKPTNDPNEIKSLLIQQIEKPVRWRETVINMIGSNVQKFIEIGPGKVLSGLVKRIDRNVKLIQVNDIEDLKNLN